MHNRQPIIKTLDNIPRILFWGVDEFLCLSVPLFIGIYFGSLMMMPMGLILKHFYVKIKKKMPSGAFIHKIYWIFPTQSLKKVIKTLPESHYRELVL